MPRRGNQQKTGVDRRTSKFTKKNLDSELSSSKSLGRGQERNFNAFRALPNGILSACNRSGTETKSGSNLDDSNQWRNMTLSSDNSRIDELETSDDMSSNCLTSSLNSSSSRRDPLHDNEMATTNFIVRFNYLLNQLYLTSLRMVRYMITLYSSMMKATDMWFELQKPSVIALKNKLVIGCDFVKLKFEQAYPVLLKWLGHLCNILLLLLIVWVDCALRGINSFVRLGTVSFFSVLWFSLFSLVAMAGMTKFLVVLVIAALVGVFVGLVLGVLVLAISGLVFLWLYGSFWSTMLVIAVGGLAFMFGRDRLTLFTATIYSTYCAWAYVGWIGLVVALNLSFFSSAILVCLLRSTVHASTSSDQSTGEEGQPGYFGSEYSHSSSAEMRPNSYDRGSGVPSTSGIESELTSEEEVERILGCRDHYQALGLPRYVNIDASLLKREYKKKAIMVHPDKNLGNENAAEAFKKLQNAYEVLLDSLKRKTYDDELRNEELINYIKRFQSSSLKNRRNAWFSHSEGDNPFEDPRRIACEKCNGFHLWIPTKKPKSRARWCQDCNEFHLVKDGDGWVEQFPSPFLFGLLRKVDPPSAYVCADSKIYEISEWFMCQEMRCPVNTHKPSFHVNTSVIFKPGSGGKRSSNSGSRNFKTQSSTEDEPPINPEEFFRRFQNAMQSDANASGGSSSGKRKKKGKKQW